MHKQDNNRGRLHKIIAAVICALLAGVAVWAIATLIWETSLWDNLKMDEVVNQLSTPVEGTASNILGTFYSRCLLPAGLAVLVAGQALLAIRGHEKFLKIARIAGVLCGVCVLAAVAYAFVTLEVADYFINSRTNSDYIEKNYVNPNDVEIQFPEQKRNLIYIWLESMETTFTDQEDNGYFTQDVIPELTELAKENVSFTGDRGGVNGGCSMAGATWTMGALFAQTAGLPLKIPIAESAMSAQETFFPGTTTLGDILQDNGYNQAFLLGSDATFGGRKLYFETHGNYEILDYNYSLEQGQIPEDYHVWWGYEDSKLFEFAKEYLTKQAQSDEPFNLSILTVDTHFPDGYVCDQCGDEFGDDQYSNVMACSSRQVAAFVQWVQRQPFYANTTIVLSGDHITMDAGYCDEVSSDYQRRVYTTFINPAAEVQDPTAFRNYTTFDNFPTTLAALGATIQGDRLGLGVNLFSRKSTLLECDGFDELNTELKRHSDFVDTLSGIDSSVYEMSSGLSSVDTGLEVQFEDGQVTFTLHNLETIEDEVSKIEIFADVMNGDTRTTIWHREAIRQDDGTYSISMPTEELGEIKECMAHIYGTTSAGRMLIDSGYTFNLETKTVTREA